MSTDPWWTIDNGIVRVGVQAPNSHVAWDRFVEQMHPSFQVKKFGRLMPPLRDEVVVRRANEVEVAEFTASRRRSAPTQVESLFDGAAFDKRARIA